MIVLLLSLIFLGCSAPNRSIYSNLLYSSEGFMKGGVTVEQRPAILLLPPFWNGELCEESFCDLSLFSLPRGKSRFTEVSLESLGERALSIDFDSWASSLSALSSSGVDFVMRIKIVDISRVKGGERSVARRVSLEGEFWSTASESLLWHAESSVVRKSERFSDGALLREAVSTLYAELPPFYFSIRPRSW